MQPSLRKRFSLQRLQLELLTVRVRFELRGSQSRIGLAPTASASLPTICQRGRANAGRYMHWTRINTHHSSGPTAGTRELNQVGAPPQIDQDSGVIVKQDCSFALTSVVIQLLPCRWRSHKANRDRATRTPAQHGVPCLEGPDLGGSGRGGMDEQGRNVSKGGSSQGRSSELRSSAFGSRKAIRQSSSAM